MHPRTYAIYGYLAAGGATLGGLALAAAAMGDRQGRVWWPISRLGSSGMLRACGVAALHLEGTERLATCRPAIVMANHESLFDPAVLMRASDEPLRFVAKKELSRMPVFGRALTAMGHVFVDRSGAEEARRALERAAARIRDGNTVLVFPEGTRADGDELLPFKTGAFRLAVEARVPILPVGIAGPRNILPKGGGFRKTGDVALVVGEPIDTGDRADDLPELVATVRGAIEALRARARRRAGI
jgi:1-acyl-sn-glycerol-3-phosphate acyltransferase